MHKYLIYKDGRLVAAVTSWEAKQAVLRLLCGTSLVLPPNIRTEEL